VCSAPISPSSSFSGLQHRPLRGKPYAPDGVTLHSDADSPGTAHGYDLTGQITIRATLSDKSVALLRVTVP
jgi:hypothetical protein